VDGNESLESVLEGVTEGDLGVKRPVKSLSKARREGVLGNCTELGVIGTLNGDALFGEGVCLRGVLMFGRAKDPFVGDFDDDALKPFVGDVGEGGVDKTFIEAGDLGEADARSRVSFEGLFGTTNCGRSAMGSFDISVASACSYGQKIRLNLFSDKGTHLDPSPQLGQDRLSSLLTVSCPACNGSHATAHILV